MKKIIHQIAISNKPLGQYVPPNLSSIKEHFSDYKYVFWNYEKIKSFILKNKDNHVLKAIDDINANAFKADIARYYILYKIGGWYTDLNNFFTCEPPETEHELVFFRDIQEHTSTSWAVQNSLFYSDVKHVILLDALNASIRNVENKYYGGHPLCPTGPNLFGSVIAKNNLPENNTYLIGNNLKKQNNDDGFYFGNQLFARWKPNGLKEANSGIPGENNYANLWHSRSLY